MKKTKVQNFNSPRIKPASRRRIIRVGSLINSKLFSPILILIVLLICNISFNSLVYQNNKLEKEISERKHILQNEIEKNKELSRTQISGQKNPELKLRSDNVIMVNNK